MEKEIQKCIEVLQNGGTILYPTDTLWGIGCDATNEAAIKKVLQIKQSPPHKNMLILCSGLEQVKEYVSEIPVKALELLNQTQTPLTIIYPNAKNLPPTLLAEDGSIGIRIPNNDFCIQLIAAFGKPIVSTSANISSLPAPTNFHQITQEIRSRVDYVVNYQQEETSAHSASQIIKIVGNEVIKIR